MSEQTDATDDRSDDEDIDRARDEREEPGETANDAETVPPAG